MQTSELPRLNLPLIDMQRVQCHGDESRIFDVVRRKWVALTPEEWVRQNFVAWLLNNKGYSVYRIANEIGIKVNQMSRRCDTVIFDRSNRPCIIIEYKAPSVSITQKVFDQIVRYNMALKAKFLIVSNGLQHYCCKIDYEANTYQFLAQIPDGQVTEC